MTTPTAPPTRKAYLRFRDALIDFSDDPSPENLVRYLAASRALEASHPPPSTTRAATSDRGERLAA
jgi:hypothetical protein